MTRTGAILAILVLVGGCSRDISTGAAGQALASADLGADAALDQGGGCGALTAAGCCAAAGVVRHCSSGTIKTVTCAAGYSCSWQVAYGLYGCASGAPLTDPSGLHPYSCGAADAGAADAAAPAADAGGADLGACAGLGHAGCCQGHVLYFCTGGMMVAQNCAATPSCGWNASAGYYSCGTAGKADPSGKHPLACLWPGDAGIAPDGMGGDGPASDMSGTPPDLVSSPAGDALVDQTVANEGYSLVPDTLAHKDGTPVPDMPPRELGGGVDVSGFEGGAGDLAPPRHTFEGGGCSHGGAASSHTFGGSGWAVLLLLGLAYAAARRRWI